VVGIGPLRRQNLCANALGCTLGHQTLRGAQIITWNDEYRHLGGRRWLAEHALGTRVSLAANSRLIQFAACKAGLGVGILPAFAADREPDLVCLLPPRKVLSTKLWLVVHHDLAQVVRVRAVMDFLAASGQSNPKLDARQFCPLWVISRHDAVLGRCPRTPAEAAKTPRRFHEAPGVFV
jgi:DNA-binding transcriptional LysR family regulator